MSKPLILLVLLHFVTLILANNIPPKSYNDVKKIFDDAASAEKKTFKWPKVLTTDNLYDLETILTTDSITRGTKDHPRAIFLDPEGVDYNEMKKYDRNNNEDGNILYIQNDDKKYAKGPDKVPLLINYGIDKWHFGWVHKTENIDAMIKALPKEEKKDKKTGKVTATFGDPWKDVILYVFRETPVRDNNDKKVRIVRLSPLYPPPITPSKESIVAPKKMTTVAPKKKKWKMENGKWIKAAHSEYEDYLDDILDYYQYGGQYGDEYDEYDYDDYDEYDGGNRMRNGLQRLLREYKKYKKYYN